MKVLLTGDRGYIGTVMKEYLRLHGHSVVGLDTNYFTFCVMGDFRIPEMTEHHIDKDIRDVVEEDLKGFDAVIHLAALSNDQMGEIDNSLTEDINLNATTALAINAKRAGVKRFIFASSCSVYGASDLIRNEGSMPAPITTYAKCKLEAELAIKQLASKDFTPAILRNATVFGFSPRLRNDLVVNTMTCRAFTDTKIQVNGDGKLWRPLVHVKDVARAFLIMLEADKDKVHGKTFNVGFNTENYQIGKIAKIVQKYVRSDIVYVPSEDTRNYHVDFSLIAKTFPEFTAHYRSVEDGIRKLVDVLKDFEALREYPMEQKYLFGMKYIRLQRLKHLMEVGLVDERLRWVE